MGIGTIVKTSRSRLGLGQVALSALSGVAQSALSRIESGRQSPEWGTVEKILRATGQQLVAIPSLREDAATIADAIRTALSNDDEQRALRLFLQLNDNLVAEHREVRFALAIAEPPRTGRRQWDAAIAALVELRLEEEGLPVPAWVTGADRRLKREWIFGAGPYVTPVELSASPEPFAKRRVALDPSDLVSV